MEVWKTTKAIEGFYEVSDEGRVRRIAPPRRGNNTFVGKILKNRSLGARYFYVTIHLPGRKQRTTPVHRLVCEAFNGPPPEGKEVSHKNNEKSDLRACNLEWATHRQNAQNTVFAIWAKRRYEARGIPV